MVKFRTMSADAEERLGELVDLERLEEPAFKIEADPRVTRSGRFLRRTSLDELPQLINVLFGDMSLVGPRPEEEAVVALYDERQRARLAIRPGLTGPMQVYGRGDLTFEERLAMERDYLDNLSVTGDIAILLRTPAGDHPRRGRLLSAMDLETIVVSHGAEGPAAAMPALARGAPRERRDPGHRRRQRQHRLDPGDGRARVPGGAADPPRQHRLLGRQQPRPARGGRRRGPAPQPRHRGLRGDARHRPRQAALRPGGSGWSGASW